MDKRSLLFTALALSLTCRCGTTLASETNDHHVGSGIHEVADPELADMRGRYVAGDNTVLWFGVEMISSWQTNNGQTLQSAMTLGLNFSKNPNQPQVTFVPTVTITTLNNAPATSTASNVTRGLQSGGLANVGGLLQGVQLAGDHNAASNVTSLSIQNSGNVPTSGTLASSNSASSTNDASTTPTSTTTTGSSTSDGRVASAGNASASSTYSNDSAQVSLSVAGQGAVSQWIHQGSLGQTIALTADNQIVTNQMIVSMVTQSMNTTTAQLAHNLAQSLNLNHSNR